MAKFGFFYVLKLLLQLDLEIDMCRSCSSLPFNLIENWDYNFSHSISINILRYISSSIFEVFRHL